MTRIVVIGANAAGAKAAAKAKRCDHSAEVTLIGRGKYISYGACGIPYFVSGMVAEIKELMTTPVGVVRDAPFFRKVKGVETLTETEAEGIDREKKTVRLLEKATGRRFELPYDKLVLATGSSPVTPPLPGIELANIVAVKSIEDAQLLKEKAVAGRRACIVGGGLIGLESAEALQMT